MQKSSTRDGDDGNLGRHKVLASECGCDAATVHARDDVSTREFHKIWTDQCEAAHDMRLRYGPQAAFDYVVAEKLLILPRRPPTGLSSRESCPGLSPV